MNDWREVRLGDVADITMGQSPSGSAINDADNGIPFFQGSAEFSWRYPIIKKWTTDSKRSAKCGDILFSVRAPVADMNIANCDCSIGRGVASIRTYPEKANHRFIEYYLKNTHDKWDAINESGSVFGCASKNDLNNFKILLPSLEEQGEIAGVLGALDDKIEANRKQNETLEAMAAAIFKNLFSDKDPNGLIGDILNEMPKSIIKVNDAKDNNGLYPFFTSGKNIFKYDAYLVNGRNIFLNTGGTADVKFYIGKAAYSTDTWCINAKNNLTDMLYLFLSGIIDEINSSYFEGSALKHLQKPEFRKIKIYIPNENEILEFNDSIKILFDKISINNKENDNLAQVRDSLLPRLMSGTLRLSPYKKEEE